VAPLTAGGWGHSLKNITTHWQLSPVPAAELISSFKQAPKKKKALQRDGIPIEKKNAEGNP